MILCLLHTYCTHGHFGHSFHRSWISGAFCLKHPEALIAVVHCDINPTPPKNILIMITNYKMNPDTACLDVSVEKGICCFTETCFQNLNLTTNFHLFSALGCTLFIFLKSFLKVASPFFTLEWLSDFGACTISVITLKQHSGCQACKSQVKSFNGLKPNKLCIMFVLGQLNTWMIMIRFHYRHFNSTCVFYWTGIILCVNPCCSKTAYPSSARPYPVKTVKMIICYQM